MKLLNRRALLSPKSAKHFSLMNTDGTPEKTPQAPRKNICGMEYGGEHLRSKLDKVVIARMEHYLERSESLEVDIEEYQAHCAERRRTASKAFPNVQSVENK